MKFFSLIFLVAGNLISVQASAHDITIQPLTRAECDRAAMAWDDSRCVTLAVRLGAAHSHTCRLVPLSCKDTEPPFLKSRTLGHVTGPS